MNKVLKPNRANSLLGLSLDGSQLEGVVLRRSNGSVRLGGTLSASLALDVLSAEPELAGREIRNHLEAAKIRERRCVVCLPLGWALASRTMLPDLPDADVASLLDIEAERSFPYAPEALMIARSRSHLPGGEKSAIQIAVPREQVLRLEKVLRVARLDPVYFSFGLPALQTSESSDGTIALAVNENSVGLQVSAGSGLLALRSLGDAIETDGAQKRIYADVVARELRITLGTFSDQARAAVRKLRVFGSGPLATRLYQELRPRAESMGLVVEQVARPDLADLRVQLPTDAPVSPAFCLAARVLAGQPPRLDFLPPRLNAWEKLAARYSSKKLAYAGALAAAAVFLVGMVFLYQQIRLSRLQSQWAGMSGKVRELDQLQQQIKQYRPWFDDSFRSLSILRRLTQAFPEEGTLTARNIEIRATAPVTCTGTARDTQALMKTLDELRNASEIADVQLDQLRGNSPVQFTFNFSWGGRTRP